MKQIFCPRARGNRILFLILSLVIAGGCAPGEAGNGKIYKIIGSGISSQDNWTLEQLESLGAETLPSAYFDKALGYGGSEFRAIPMAELVRRFDPDGRSDAVLLNCFDDYQGIISIADIREYDLRLATKLKFQPEVKPPGWLNPLLVLVPDGSTAPFQERFLTANIRELKFTQLEAYYQPLKSAGQTSGLAGEGLSVFQNNCLFCHSLRGIGGNKGVRLLESYDFSKAGDRGRFEDDFLRFHQKDNPDKQNVQQFVSGKQLKAIGHLLMAVQSSGDDGDPKSGRD